MKHKLIPVLALLLAHIQAYAGAEVVEFPAEDGLAVTADLYLAHAGDAPFILFFHQAGWSRGEYGAIAEALNAMGYNCMAIDQRSGGEVNGVINETRLRAESAGKSTNFVDALADMRAALYFAREHYAAGKLVLWGSSYSAALVFRLAAEYPAGVDALIAFSPGEYFVRFGKPADWISRAAADIHLPVFIASAADERAQWEKIYEALSGSNKHFFIPPVAGNHGSRALWDEFPDAPAYREALQAFLQQYVPVATEH